jgi:hypothetical protein
MKSLLFMVSVSLLFFPQKGFSVMNSTQDVRHVTITIQRTPQEVYAFVSQPENLPKWAAGLGGNIQQVNGEWIAQTPAGKTKIVMAPKNTYGVLDHDVYLLDAGKRVHMPMRVVPNGKGSEVTLTVLRQPEMTDQKYTEDLGLVEKDLKTLKALLEKK